MDVFEKKMEIDLGNALEELQSTGIVVGSAKETLIEISEENRVSPMDIYMMIKKYEARVDSTTIKIYKPEMVEIESSGAGLGNKTLVRVC